MNLRHHLNPASMRCPRHHWDVCLDVESLGDRDRVTTLDSAWRCSVGELPARAVHELDASRRASGVRGDASFECEAFPLSACAPTPTIAQPWHPVPARMPPARRPALDAALAREAEQVLPAELRAALADVKDPELRAALARAARNNLEWQARVAALPPHRQRPAPPSSDPRHLRTVKALDEAAGALARGDADSAFDAAARAAFTLREAS